MADFSDLDRLNHIKDLETRYDSGKTAVRGIASVWLLAGFGAIGTLIQAAPPSGFFDLPFLVFLTSYAAIAGLYLLWFLDGVVYQGLFHAAFVHGLYLEYRFPDVPQIRTAMFSRWRDNTPRFRMFYVLPTRAFAAAGLIAAAFEIVAIAQTVPAALWLSLLKVVAMISVVALAILARMTIDRLAEQATVRASATALPDDFQDYLRDSERMSRALGDLTPNPDRGRPGP